MALYKIEVNGSTYYLSNTENVNAGRRWVTVDAGTGIHNVRIVGQSATRWSGYVTEVGATAEPWNADRTTIIFGDSFSASTIADEIWEGFPYNMGLSSNHNVCASAVGATGYVTASDDPNLPDRIISNYNSIIAESGVPDEVIIAMGVNDLGQAGIEAAANTTFDNLRTVFSGTVYVLSPFDGNAPSAPSANFESARDAIEAAVGTRSGFAFIDLEGVSYTKGDSTHPDTAGHLKLGQYIGNAIENATINPMPELVTNGGFDTDSWWTKIGGTTISGGVSNFFANDDLLDTSTSIITSGKTYEVIADNVGQKTLYVNNWVQNVGDFPAGVATSKTFTATTSGILRFKAHEAGTLDNVSVKEVL